jgi:hypothetical protein
MRGVRDPPLRVITARSSRSPPGGPSAVADFGGNLCEYEVLQKVTTDNRGDHAFDALPAHACRKESQ